jgi:hypothetical protein
MRRRRRKHDGGRPARGLDAASAKPVRQIRRGNNCLLVFGSLLVLLLPGVQTFSLPPFIPMMTTLLPRRPSLSCRYVCRCTRGGMPALPVSRCSPSAFRPPILPPPFSVIHRRDGDDVHPPSLRVGHDHMYIPLKTWHRSAPCHLPSLFVC